jgi:hypothetical protein
MITKNKFGFVIVVSMLTGLLQFSSCNPDLRDDPIPVASFGSVYINLNLPAYARLKTDGGYYYYDDAGVRGLIIYRQNASTYHVYERNCSYQPNEACATVNVHVSTLFMEDPCCGSAFDFVSGNPTSGVAWRPLRKYFATVSGTDLTITDEILQ